MIDNLQIDPVTLNIICHRIVEDQSISSTRKLVGSDIEHTILEELIENSKPEIPQEAQLLSHYLLSTPFRYSSIPTGTRFAAMHELQLFYASLDLYTAMAEVAFHRLSFLRACRADLSETVSRTSFAAKISTNQGIDLLKSPFIKHAAEIISPSSYKFSQALGTTLRAANVEAFTSQSARYQKGTNANVLHPRALLKNTYADIQKSCSAWSCYSTPDIVEFRHRTDTKISTKVFSVNDFWVAGEFPKVI